MAFNSQDGIGDVNMAFLVSVELDNGLTVENSYCRINSVNIYKTGVSITMVYYKDRELAVENAPFIKQEQYSFPKETEEESYNFDLGYLKLKTLPRFENATNVLEEGQTPLNE